MSNVNGDGSDRKMKFEQMTKSSLFTFSKPYLDFIAKGKIFSIIYLVMAIVNLILPFVALYMLIKSRVFELGAKFGLGAILSWLVFVFACWVGFQLWYERRKETAGVGSSQFVATVMFSEIFQTFGEWIGTMIGIIGAGVGLLGSIFLGDDVGYLLNSFGLGFMNFGIGLIVIAPIIGFFIIIISRFIAEQFRMFAALVNNTGDIAKNCK